MASRTISTTEISLLRKEIEVQGDFINQEKLERIADFDKLRIEVEAAKDALNRLIPGFQEEFEKSFSDLLHNFDPQTNQLSFLRRSG